MSFNLAIVCVVIIALALGTTGLYLTRRQH